MTEAQEVPYVVLCCPIHSGCDTAKMALCRSSAGILASKDNKTVNKTGGQEHIGTPSGATRGAVGAHVGTPSAGGEGARNAFSALFGENRRPFLGSARNLRPLTAEPTRSCAGIMCKACLRYVACHARNLSQTAPVLLQSRHPRHRRSAPVELTLTLRGQQTDIKYCSPSSGRDALTPSSIPCRYTSVDPVADDPKG